MRRHRKLIACAGLIAGILLFPTADISLPSLGPWSGLDLLVHAGLFAVLCRVLRTSLARGRSTLADVSAWALVVAYGAGLELLQQWVPGRDASLADAAANSVGALAVLLLGRR